MDLQRLKGFYYSAKFGSLTKAAEKMNITQSAVSQQISSLEDELNIKLFHRYGPQKDLTHAGEIFYELISSIIISIEDLKTTFEDKRGIQKGVLTFAATTFIIMNILPKVITAFSEKYQDIKFRILERRWPEIISLTQSGEIDFGITPIHDNIPKNLIVINLEPIERILITSQGHELAKKKNISLYDIQKYPIISYEKGLISRKELDEVFKKHNLNPYIIIEATNAETIKQYVEKGIGIAIIPKTAIEGEHKPYLEVIPISHFFNKSCYGVIIKKGKYITTWTKKFLSMLNPDWKSEMEIN